MRNTRLRRGWLWLRYWTVRRVSESIATVGNALAGGDCRPWKDTTPRWRAVARVDGLARWVYRWCQPRNRELEREDAENFAWFCAIWDAWDTEEHP